MKPSLIEVLGAGFFFGAVIHTFLTGKILHFSRHFPKDSLAERIFHLLGEIEIVFALWGVLFMILHVLLVGWEATLQYQQSLDFIEPFFIFAIMVLCSTRPILVAARAGIYRVSQFLQWIFKTPGVLTDLFVVLFLGPLAGSLITEPAAMTVTALLLHSMLKETSQKLLYILIAVLFVNVSIGGALTSFAAPPILMVTHKWGWDFQFVFMHFGWKSMIAVFLNTLGLILIFRKDLLRKSFTLREVILKMESAQNKMPMAVVGSHLVLLFGIVLTSHHQNAFMGVFLIFLAVYFLTKDHQDELRLREGLLVGVFLGGIILFGTFQKWWLAPLLSHMADAVLFSGAVALTALTDNAALTYLGSQVAGLSESSRYALVAGAISGGGLTLIANAPNAAGYSILGERFKGGLNPLRLFLAALVPTAVAIACLF